MDSLLKTGTGKVFQSRVYARRLAPRASVYEKQKEFRITGLDL